MGVEMESRNHMFYPWMYYTDDVDHTMVLGGRASSVYKIVNSILFIELILEL